MLTKSQLEAYESRLREHGLSVADRFRPGLSEAEIDARTGPLGVRLPTEARIWFGWHDGADHSHFDVQIAPGFVFLTLDDAIAQRTFLLELADTVDRNDDPTWRPEWFPLLRAYAIVACDCSVPEGAPTPLRAIDPAAEPDSFGKPKAASLGELVDLWIRSWDTGAWKADLDRDVIEVRRTQPLADGSRNYLLDT